MRSSQKYYCTPTISIGQIGNWPKLSGLTQSCHFPKPDRKIYNAPNTIMFEVDSWNAFFVLVEISEEQHAVLISRPPSSVVYSEYPPFLPFWCNSPVTHDGDTHKPHPRGIGIAVLRLNLMNKNITGWMDRPITNHCRRGIFMGRESAGSHSI